MKKKHAGPFEFRYAVPASGFEWRSDLVGSGADPGPWLCIRMQAGAVSTPAGFSAPLETPSLHRSFAGVRPTQSGIKHFADKHGALREGEVLAAPEGGQVISGDSITTWSYEISRMKILTTIWDLVRDKRAGPLGHYVRWVDDSGGRAVSFAADDAVEMNWGALIAGNGENDQLLDRWRTGDVIGPASYFVAREINGSLKEHVSPAVLPFYRGEILMIPDCLLSAMYVLFALEVSGRERPSKICRGCGKYFTPGHGNRVYHDTECQKRNWWNKNRGKRSNNVG